MNQSPRHRQFFDFLDEESRENAIVDDISDAGADEGSELSGSVFKEVKKKMISLQLRLSESEGELDLTKQALSKIRSQVRDEIDAAERSCAEQISRQREEFESVLQRQLLFSKTVLGEKQALATKVDELIEAASQRERKLTDLKDQEQKKVQKVKTAMKAAERVRRERFVDELRATIKQDTIRALEPEVQRLIDEHADERRRTAEHHEQALQQQLATHQAEIRKLRDQLQGEFQRQLEHERQMANDQLERVVQDQQQAIQQARMRHQRELEQEQRRVTLESGEERRAFGQALKHMQLRLEKSGKEPPLEAAVDDLRLDDDFWSIGER